MCFGNETGLKSVLGIRLSFGLKTDLLLTRMVRNVSSYRGNWFHQEYLLQSEFLGACSESILIKFYRSRVHDKHEITCAGANESDVH